MRGLLRAGRRGTLAPWGLACCHLIMTSLLATATPASAKILKTNRPGQISVLALTVGSGFEFATDSEQTEYDFPFLLEYGVTEALKLAAEPNYVHVNAKDGGTISGFGDLETSVTYEFLSERRYRPSLSAQGLIKWPTAAHNEFGTGKVDYSLGTIVSKEFVHTSLDLNVIYTFVKSPPGSRLQNILETSLAAEWHLSSVFDLEGEIVASIGSGSGSSGKPSSIGSFGTPGGRETEGTLGIAELLSERLKLEEGFILKSDASWQAVAAWEWDFGEGR